MRKVILMDKLDMMTALLEHQVAMSADLINKFGGTESKINKIEQGFATAISELVGLRSELRAMQLDVQAIKGEMRSINAETQAFKGDFRVLKAESQMIKSTAEPLRSEFQSVRDEVRTIAAELKNIIKHFEEVEANVNSIKKDIHIFKTTHAGSGEI